MKRRILFITTFCIYLAAVLFLCLMRPDDLPQTELTFWGIPIDKIAHFLMFLPFPVLSFSMIWTKGRKIWIDTTTLAICLCIGVGMAFLTEKLQAMTQYRSSDIQDIYADITGLCIGCLPVLLYLIVRIARKYKSQ